MNTLITPSNSLNELRDLWTPNEPEFLNRWLDESLGVSKLTDQEKRIVDGVTVLGIFEGCCCVPDGYSDNERFYPFECFFKPSTFEIVQTDLLDQLQAKNWYGSIGHEDKKIDEDDVREGKHAFITYKYWYDPKIKLGMARHMLLNTKAGWNMFVPMKAGSAFKMSSRAKGDFKENSFKERNGSRIPVVDPSTFHLYNYDSVIVPGFKQTSAVLQEKKEIIEVRSNLMSLDESLVRTQDTLNEALKDNATLTGKVKELEITNNSLLENQKKYSVLSTLNESALSVINSFTNADFDVLLSSKVKHLGEAKAISFNKGGKQYDSILIPVNVPLITESRLRQAVMSRKLFESFPLDVAVVTRKGNPEIGQNGLVLSWDLGARPKVKNLQEGFSKFVKLSGLFEASYDDGVIDDENTEDKEDSLDSTEDTFASGSIPFKSEKKKMKKEANSDPDNDLDKEDKEELNEWRAFSEGTKPAMFMKQVRSIKEALTKYVDAYGSFDRLQEKMDSLEFALGTHEALGTGDTQQVAKWKYFYEYINESLGSPDAVLEELVAAKNIYQYISEVFGTLPKAEKSLKESKKIIKKLLKEIEKAKDNDEDEDTEDQEYTNEAEDKESDEQDDEDDSNVGFVEKKKMKKEAKEDPDSEDEDTEEDDSEEEEQKEKNEKRKFRSEKRKMKKENDASMDDEEDEEPKAKKGDEDKETLEESAKRISKEIKGTWSFNEVYGILKDYKGKVSLAEKKIFAPIKKAVQGLNEVKSTKPNNKTGSTTVNESYDPIGSGVRSNNPVVHSPSLLGGYYDSMENGKVKN